MDVIIDDIISQVNLEDKEFIANEPSLGIWSEFVIFFPPHHSPPKFQGPVLLPIPILPIFSRVDT